MPAAWSIYSWNTQGDFTALLKKAQIDGQCGRGRVVVCLQEGGVGKSGAQGNWHAETGSSVGAFNERCTNYVLVDATYARFVTVRSLILSDKNNSVVVGGGEAGRTPAAIGLGDTLFVSWHSLAGKSNEDTAMLVRAIDGNETYRATYRTVIIGGDFNAAPADIANVIAQGTDRTRAAWHYQHRQVFSSGAVTHPHSGTELDFFIVMSTAAIPGGTAATRIAVPVSDHEMVRLSIWL